MKKQKVIKKIIQILLFGGVVISSLPVHVFASAGAGNDSCSDNIGISDNKFDVENLKFKEIFKEIKGYDLEKILNIKEKFLGLYKHQKTGALVVAVQMTNEEDDNECFEIFFKMPSENNKGTNHALEHCILHKLLHRDTLANGHTSCTGVKFSVENVPFDYRKFTDVIDFNQELKILLEQLKEPDFIDNDDIFDIEVCSEYTGFNGQKFTRGRVFMERQKEFVQTSSYNPDEYGEFRTDTKFKFHCGGIPDDILNLKKSEVVDIYNKYIHPSNSLSIIQSCNYEDIMNQLDTVYFSEYKKKDIDVSFNIEDCDEIKDKDYEKSNRKFGNTIYNKSKYLARIFYDLKNFNAKELEQFELIENIFIQNSHSLTKSLSLKGYEGIFMNFDEINGYPYMVFELFGDDVTLFQKDVLTKNISEFINNFINNIDIKNLNLMDWNDYDDYKLRLRSHSLFNKIYNSFALYKDPFSNKCFNLDSNFIVDRKISKDQMILKDLKDLVPKKISILEADKESDENNYISYSFNFDIDCENYLMKNIVMCILNNYILNDNLYANGMFYAKFILDPYNNQMATSESYNIRYATDFFNDKFKEAISNFRVTDEILEKTKKLLYHDMFLYLNEFSKEEKEFIDNLTVEEVQENLQKVSYSKLTSEIN